MSLHSVKLAAVVATLLAVGIARTGRAQVVRHAFQSEARIDGIFSEENTAVHAGYGMSVPIGLYFRWGAVVGAGAGRRGLEGRSDLIGRFSFDPFRQSRWAPYAGGGISGRYNSTEEGGGKGYLLFFLGIEGGLAGPSSGWAPAFELGLGGGGRVGFIVRRAVRGRR